MCNDTLLLNLIDHNCLTLLEVYLSWPSFTNNRSLREDHLKFCDTRVNNNNTSITQKLFNTISSMFRTRSLRGPRTCIHIKMTKSENSTSTESSSKTSSKTINTSNTTLNDTLVDVGPPNIQTNTNNKFHIQNFKITNENFHI
ncbi:hypothetical protein H8356DRAFT_1363036 [Neocallimastix lanati (nom. inval.)]|nr:hypothetical protein H8356DRAFT_1363036 [Neocallimastix sp. JGI-2020a]